MRILLLGPNGQLGSDIVRSNQGLDLPHDIVPVGRDKLDITDIPAIGAVLKELDFDVAINCTSYHKTDEVEANAGRAMAVNAHGVKAIAEACVDKRARLFHVSTDYVFGGAAEKAPYNEEDPTAPVNVYGASKLLGENLAMATGADVTILRVASLFGVAGASGKGGNFVETMIRLGREKGVLRIVDDQIMSPTSTLDIARTLLLMLEKGSAPGHYHVVNSDGGVSWCEFAREIIRQTVIDAKVEAISSSEYPTPAMRPHYSPLDNAKVTASIGHLRSWRDALADYLRDKGHTGK